MSRKTVKVTVPINKPDEFSKLIKTIVAQHTEEGSKSPLKSHRSVNMSTFKTLSIKAEGLRSKAEQLRHRSEKLMEQSRVIYGNAKGQTISTPYTLYNMVDDIKDTLLLAYKGNEESLGEWGFDVSVGSAKSPGAKGKPGK